MSTEPNGKLGHLAMMAIVAVVAVLAIVVVSRRPGAGKPAPETALKGAEQPPPPPDNGLGAWATVQVDHELLVKAEDATKLEAKMEQGQDLDNEGVQDETGARAKVRFVWVQDDAYEEEKEGAAESEAVFELKVEKPGTYYPWARAWWPDSCGDSLRIKIPARSEDEKSLDFLVIDGTHEWWHWLPVAGASGIELGEGTHTVIVENREDGARLSRILFSTLDYETYKPETPEG